MAGGAVGSFRSGKGGRMLWGATKLKGQKWAVAESGANLDTTNFECFTTVYGSSGSGGGRSFSQQLVGIETAKVDYEGHWDSGINAYDNPPGVYIRDDGPQAKMVLNQVDANFYLFYATTVLSANLDCSVTGLLEFKFGFQNQGPYVRPTGSFA